MFVKVFNQYFQIMLIINCNYLYNIINSFFENAALFIINWQDSEKQNVTERSETLPVKQT